MKKILVLNGPNLGQLGKREPEIYGQTTLSELEQQLINSGKDSGAAVECFQSNHEGELIDRMLGARERNLDGIILNAGGLTHTSVALLDAIRACEIPTIEVHISHIHAREEFRQETITGQGCLGVITGLGTKGYHYALDYLINR